MCVCVCVHICLQNMLNNNCNAFLLLCLLLFMYFSSYHMATTTTPKMLCSTLHTHQTRERPALSRCVFVQLIVRIRTRTRLELTLSLSPNSGFLIRSLNFCRLRSVQLLTSRLWVRNRLKESAARASFQIYLIIRTSLVVALLPLRCCCCCTCCCRVAILKIHFGSIFK